MLNKLLTKEHTYDHLDKREEEEAIIKPYFTLHGLHFLPSTSMYK